MSEATIILPAQVVSLKGLVNMVKIRLRRTGRKNSPSYRIIVSDSRKAPTSSALAELGHFDPQDRRNYDLKIDEALAIEWLLKGAIPSDSVKTLLKKSGVYAKFLEAKKAKKAE